MGKGVDLVRQAHMYMKFVSVVFLNPMIASLHVEKVKNAILSCIYVYS